jgi:amino acid transporter
MLIITIVGIRITARTQVGMAAIEYLILIGLAIAGLVVVLNHRSGTYPITKDWFSLSGVGGHGSLTAGLLIAVFIYSGWEGTLYVNEEVKHRRVNPGKAAVIAVVLLTVIYALVNLGLSGLVTPAKLQANSTSALVYVTQAQFGGGWAKIMALSLALSVVAATGTNILLTSRIIYGMAATRQARIGAVRGRFRPSSEFPTPSTPLPSLPGRPARRGSCGTPIRGSHGPAGGPGQCCSGGSPACRSCRAWTWRPSGGGRCRGASAGSCPE